MTFTHLHVHSHYSVLDGMSKVPDLVDKAIKMGMPAIALTDHGCMYGIKELLDYTKKANKKLKEKAKEEGIEYVPFKPIVGVEAYCARRGRLLRDKDLKAPNTEGKSYIVDQSGWHLILLAKNMQGYRNLCKIVSASFMEDSYYRRPRIDRELLEQYHEGLICCSACLGGELPQKILKESIEDAEKSAQWFKDTFGDDFYILAAVFFENFSVGKLEKVSKYSIYAVFCSVHVCVCTENHYFIFDEVFKHSSVWG